MTKRAPGSGGVGVALFLSLSCLGSWCVAAMIRVVDVDVSAAAATRLLTASALYALTMAWPPLLATWLLTRLFDDDVDLGLRPTRPVFSVASALISIAAVGGAAAVAAVTTSPSSTVADADGATVLGVVVLIAAFVGTLAALAVQSITEEIGWRGYLLARAIARFGPWRGLLLQAAAWGIWYAPVAFLLGFDAQDARASAMRAGASVVTCALLGTLLGWLRLAAKGLGPVVVANIVLTLGTGLPYVLRGHDAGPRAAALGPIGWPILAVALVALLASRWRDAVRCLPEEAPPIGDDPSTRGVLSRVALLFGPPRDSATRYGPN